MTPSTHQLAPNVRGLWPAPESRAIYVMTERGLWVVRQRKTFEEFLTRLLGGEDPEVVFKGRGRVLAYEDIVSFEMNDAYAGLPLVVHYLRRAKTERHTLPLHSQPARQEMFDTLVHHFGPAGERTKSYVLLPYFGQLAVAAALALLSGWLFTYANFCGGIFLVALCGGSLVWLASLVWTLLNPPLRICYTVRETHSD